MYHFLQNCNVSVPSAITKDQIHRSSMRLDCTRSSNLLTAAQTWMKREKMGSDRLVDSNTVKMLFCKPVNNHAHETIGQNTRNYIKCVCKICEYLISSEYLIS